MCDANGVNVAVLLTAIANDDPDEMLASLSSGATLAAALGSPLHAACRYSATTCLTHLLAQGGSVNARDQDGYTPLHVVAMDGNADIVRRLLDARADTNAVTNDLRARLMNGGLTIDVPGGRTPLHLAAVHGHFDASVALLEANNAAAATADVDGLTPHTAGLREGAKTGAGTLSVKRQRIAQLLAPGVPIPPLEELRALARQDAARQRERADAMALTAAEANRHQGFPADHGYEPVDETLYSFGSDALTAAMAPDLSAALALPGAEERAAALHHLCSEITPGVYAFRLFPEHTKLAAPAIQADDPANLPQRLLDELRNVEAWAESSTWALKRPNSMNRYGVVLEDIGLAPLMDALVEALVEPMVAALWPAQAARGELADLSDLHAFTVRYRGGEDRHLDTHTDSSDATLNVCLGGNFRGGGVYFHGLAGAEGDEDRDPMTCPHPTNCQRCLVTHPHESGVALLHLGTHIHGAHPIEAGERTNLIVWCSRRREVAALKVV